jgi:1A family penicillin-binding protein
MQIVIDIAVLILKLIILIGDLAIGTFILSLRFFNFLKKRVKMIVFKKRSKKRKVKKLKPIKIFPQPFAQKLKYFAVGSLSSLVFIFLPLLFVIFLQELPSPKTLSFEQAPLTTKIYDRNGILLYQIYATQNRTLVPLSSIPKQLQNATIAIEDKNFYRNNGVDILAIVRAIVANLSGKPLQGGSTITQQLIKSTLLTPEVSINRKIKEIILAFWAERIYSKSQILEMYFNQVPYGGTAWGIEAASEIYFGKNVKDLNLAESAFLAGLPRAPSLYSPYGDNPNLWKKRQKEVLTRTAELGYITQDQKDEAEKEELVFQQPKDSIQAPHFVMYIKDLLVKKYGLPYVEKKGLNVITSLDAKLQDLAQKIVTDEVNNNAYLNLSNGASLITNPSNGDILTMVGSRDFYDPNGGNVNVALSLRQPGSSIKVVTYSAALSKGFTAATVLDDSPITYSFPGSPPYSPVNYDGRLYGKLPLRLALANSLNIPAVKTLNQIGVSTMVDLGKQMGITTWNNPSEYGLSITLGGADVTMLDMATVYGVLANSGVRIDLNPILKVSDQEGNILEQKQKDPLLLGKKVVDEGITFIISNILSDNNARSLAYGSNSLLAIPGHSVSVKTGTSDNKRDNWTIGYTKSYVVAAWVGNNDNSPMSQTLASGVTGAAPIWNKIMSNLLTNKPDEKTTKPSNVIEKLCLGRTEYFIIGTENSVNCNPPPSVSPSPTPSQNR